MSEGRRSFWSSVPGLVTGLAGLLTAVVGLVAVLIQLGVIGGNDSKGPGGPAIDSTVPGTGGAPGSGPTTTAELRTFEVRPTTLDFPAAGAKENTVTVTNTSATGALTSLQPALTGVDSDRFSVSSGTCSAVALPANGTCTLKVTFTPVNGAALKKYTATLRISAKDAPRVAEVTLTASTLIG